MHHIFSQTVWRLSSLTSAMKLSPLSLNTDPASGSLSLSSTYIKRWWWIEHLILIIVISFKESQEISIKQHINNTFHVNIGLDSQVVVVTLFKPNVFWSAKCRNLFQPWSWALEHDENTKLPINSLFGCDYFILADNRNTSRWRSVHYTSRASVVSKSVSPSNHVALPLGLCFM